MIRDERITEGPRTVCGGFLYAKWMKTLHARCIIIKKKQNSVLLFCELFTKIVVT